MKVWTRREVLQAALAGAGGAAWPWSGALAQSGSAALLRAPKQALVIGNGNYRHSPLRNPINDASAMAAALKEVGFGVVLGLEATQASMRDAIQAFSESLAKNKAVGLFYFAGHGAQLAWRNYLIPIDAEVVDVQELRERAVDLNGLIEGIRKAGNPMNVIILDACRDNPFGSTARLEQRGLSQLDAPPGTLLAYATAPGNTASDGDGGEHGLYTEHLLRELRVPEAKVEDVFKRVRLAVRRRSKGQQIPWESTSLEEDFWFIPPRVATKLAAEEAEREFRQEWALWEKIQSATQPEPFEDYLRRYPGGRYTELAQLQLDQVLARLGEKRIEIVSAPENPYSKGTAKTNTTYRIGDSYTFRNLDLLTRLEQQKVTISVTKITANEVVYGNGFVTDLLGNPLMVASRGERWSPNQVVATEFTVGKRWKSRFHVANPRGQVYEMDLELRVADRERITVPAGTFDAFRVDAWGWGTGAGVDVNWDWKRWYAPEKVRRPVAAEQLRKNRAGVISVSNRRELLAFKQS